MKDIFARRLKSARTIKGFSMETLANAIGVSKQMVSKYEKAMSFPDSKLLIKIASALNFKPDYFFKPYKVELGTVEFRKKASLSKTKVEGIKNNILHLLENYLELEDILGINYTFNNPLKKNEASNEEDVEAIADELRSVWNLGLDPIHNVISILEDHEIKIIEVDEDTDAFDGLSTFVGGKYPVIVVNKNFPIERKRFTLLHELAHLLLAIPVECTHKEKENKCHHFAGSLLLPMQVIRLEFGNSRRQITINELMVMQRRYGLSIPAIIYRLRNAGLISENTLRHFYISQNTNKSLKEQVNQSRFKSEEQSERFERLVYRAMAQEFISTSKASAYLQQSVQEVKNNFALI
jgi:Zn-dependent peptidase ImmA (M78 family)/DNA-binding XRE family transcriptional regulator